MTLHLLALETSSNICDVALLAYRDGQQRLYTASNDETGRHAECLLPMVNTLLAQAGIGRHQLDVVAFGQGPGGFTGLRVASGVTQGMAFGLGIPVVPVPSLLAVAVRAAREHAATAHPGAYYLVVQDARMGELYLAVYRAPQDGADGAWSTVQAPILIDAEEVAGWFARHAPGWGLTPDAPAFIAGDALTVLPKLASLDGGQGLLKAAGAWRADASTIAHIAQLAWQRGNAQPPESAVPLYVRDKVAYTLAEQQRGAGGNPRAPVHGLILKTMAPEHIDAVAAIEARVQQFPWTRQNFADGLKAGYPAWVVCQNDRVIGFCMLLIGPDVAHVLVIAVDPDYQGRGVGKMLIDHCQQQATQHGLNTLVLEVRPSNQGAVGFYQHLGFKEFGKRRDYYPAPNGKREDASVMEKTWSRPQEKS